MVLAFTVTPQLGHYVFKQGIGDEADAYGGWFRKNSASVYD